MALPSDTAVPDSGKLHKPVARLLRPLVRLLIRAGLTFPALCDLLRELYVDVAEQEFALAGKMQTDSRVSLLTGIHRKEVSRLRGARAPGPVLPPSASRSSLILARWMGSPLYTDGAGRPLPLPRVAASGVPSFESLVESVTRDVRPRAVLDEWLDRKIVGSGEEGTIVLLASAFIPKHGEDDLLYYFGRNLHDHMAAAVANVSGRQPPYIERAVHYDNLSEGLVRRLESRSREIVLDALKAANHEAMVACETDEGGSWRWNFGVYIYAAPDEGKEGGAGATVEAGPRP